MVANSSHRFSSTSRCLAVAIGISLLASGRLATAGNLFVADQSLGRIYEYTPSGTQSTFFTNTSLAPTRWRLTVVATSLRVLPRRDVATFTSSRPTERNRSSLAQLRLLGRVCLIHLDWRLTPVVTSL